MVGQIKPKTVLDIGFGRGKYGFLLREYYSRILERVDGLDVFEPYVTPLQKLIYDNIYIANALDMEDPMQYDLYLIIDVLEHWPRERAYALLDKLVTKGKVIISTPRSIGEQGAEFGNEWERHITQWLPVDFALRYDMDDFSTDCSFMYVLKGKIAP